MNAKPSDTTMIPATLRSRSRSSASGAGHSGEGAERDEHRSEARDERQARDHDPPASTPGCVPETADR